MFRLKLMVLLTLLRLLNNHILALLIFKICDTGTTSYYFGGFGGRAGTATVRLIFLILTAVTLWPLRGPGGSPWGALNQLCSRTHMQGTHNTLACTLGNSSLLAPWVLIRC